METFGNDLGAKTSKNEQTYFYCENCDYKCSKKFNWTRHLLTSKHLMEINGNDFGAKTSKKGQIYEYICEKCNKLFQTNAGLWKHKLKDNCLKNNSIVEEKNEVINLYKNTINDKDELIITLLKQNAELIKGQQDMLVKISENGINNNNSNYSNNTTHTNSHNKAFNLQFFLNETCKEAMNIGEFIESIKMELCDLENIGEVGYIEGISNIIVKNLKELDITKRPVHCTDKKRETIYIKDENKWEKDENKTQMHKLIKRVVSKNVKMFAKFKEAHPDCLTYHSKYSEQYNKIIYESMGGKGDDDHEKNEKIIKNVLKEVVVDKNI
jgi:hypothetical protein